MIIIISSKGHWRNGWLTNSKRLQIAIDILEKAGVRVQSVEVENIEQLDKVLDNVSEDALIWSNAYYVNDGGDKIIWLNNYIQKRNLPLLGSNAQTLRNLLQKDVCQSILNEANIPIPRFTVIATAQGEAAEKIIAQSGIGFPMVLKPTAESGSVGIAMAISLEKATQIAKKILIDFPYSNVIIEQFLPSDDITCGFLQFGDEILLLPTSYIVQSVPGKYNILDRSNRLQKWDDKDKMQLPIRDEIILTQLRNHIPNIASALNIRDITRIDGRLDKNGTLLFFDVNGLPALDFPDSVMNKQCFTCFPDYSQEEVYKGLIYTIVANALMRYGMEVPLIMQAQNLFTMESEIAIKLFLDRY